MDLHIRLRFGLKTRQVRLNRHAREENENGTLQLIKSVPQNLCRGVSVRAVASNGKHVAGFPS